MSVPRLWSAVLPLLVSIAAVGAPGGAASAGQCLDCESEPPPPPPPPPPQRFDYRENRDILWHNASTGAISSWHVSESHQIAETALSWHVPSSTGWQIVGSGQFDRFDSGDGFVDLLWHNPGTGELSVWFLNGTSEPRSTALLPWLVPGSTGWQVIGVDRGPSHNHIFWHQPSTGTISVWVMEGTTPIRTYELDFKLHEGLGWRLIGVADVNDDGAPDLIGHHGANGWITFFHLSGRRLVRMVEVSQQILSSTGWSLEAAWGNYDIRRVHLVWHHPSSGKVSVWSLDTETGARVVGGGELPWNARGSSGWSIAPN